MEYKTFRLTVDQHIAHLEFNRPEKSNSLNQDSWREMKEIFSQLDTDPTVRVIVLSGAGKHFCGGIDLTMLMGQQQVLNDLGEGRKREKLREFILYLQDAINAIEQCRKPVLAAIHNGCIGGGVDIICACDMRYAAEDAWFTVKEIDLGMVADLGTLQRLPKIVPPGIAAEWAFTGRKVSAVETKEVGFTNQVFADKAAMLEGVMEIARTIAGKSPLSIRGTKQMLLYARDHSVADGLSHMATWNAAMFLSSDLEEAFRAFWEKRPAEFTE